MKVGYGFNQVVDGVIRKYLLESAEGFCGVEENFFVFNALAGMCIENEVIATPEIYLGIDIIGLAVLGRVNGQALSFGVAAVCDNNLAA